ncbi:MAG: metallophosphoesterase [Gorillibacterium sp.]|nr:metallophosphoesterase [Gorillibacterium sp.]
MTLLVHKKRTPRRRFGNKVVAAAVFVTALATLTAFLYTQNNWLGLTRITVDSKRIPSAFDGYKIVHLSDLHGKGFGKGQKRLLAKVEKEAPDLIAFTGDLVDRGGMSERTRCLELMKGLVAFAPVYLITGNHDQTVGGFDSLEQDLTRLGVKVLRDKSTLLERGGSEVLLAGIDDPLFTPYADRSIQSVQVSMSEAIEVPSQAVFKILLAHRPELFSTYADAQIDLILSGHAHGGQVRLPFVGGLVAPGQGFFPHYTSGAYREDNSVMVVSRGLGNSILPQRLFNRPEIIAITLRKS